MKKIFSIFLGLLMAQSSLVFAETPTLYGAASFSDVNDSMEFYSSIDWMQRNNVISGYPDGTFKPEACVNRVEFLKMLFKTLGVDENMYTADLFSDTPEGAWFIPYVKTARARNVINGYADGTFKPGQCVTKAEATKMALLMYYPINEIENPSYVPDWYNDLKPSDWYYYYVGFAYDRNFWVSQNIESLDTNVGMKRAEVAELLYRLKSTQDNGQVRYSWLAPLNIGEKPFYDMCEYTASVNTSKMKVSDILPSGSDVVLSLNYADAKSKENFKAMLDKFPDSGIWDTIKESMYYNTRPENNLTNLITPVLEDDYEVMIGVDFKDDVVDFNNSENVDVFIAGKVAASEEFYSILKKSVGVNFMQDMVCEIDGDNLYWTIIIDDFYFVRHGDIYFLTNSEAGRDGAIRRLKLGGGYEMNSSASASLFYVFAKMDMFADLFSSAYGEVGATFASDLYKTFGATEMYVSATSPDQLRLDGNIQINDREILNGYSNKYVSLINKIPANNLIAYIEDANLKLLFEPYFTAYSLNASADMPSTKDELYAETGINESDFNNLLDSPYSISLAEVGQVYPGVIFAVKLDSYDLAPAKKLVSWLNNKVDVLIDEADSNMETVDFKNLVNKMDLGSGNFKRVKVDMSRLPENFWVDEMMTEERAYFGNTVFDFWYGIKEDSDMNVLVFALYPDLDMYYGMNVVRDSLTYKNAVDLLGGVYGANVSYLSVPKLMSYAEKLMVLNGMDLQDEEYLQIKRWINTFDFVISSSQVDDDMLISRGVLKLK